MPRWALTAVITGVLLLSATVVGNLLGLTYIDLAVPGLAPMLFLAISRRPRDVPERFDREVGGMDQVMAAVRLSLPGFMIVFAVAVATFLVISVATFPVTVDVNDGVETDSSSFPVAVFPLALVFSAAVVANRLAFVRPAACAADLFKRQQAIGLVLAGIAVVLAMFAFAPAGQARATAAAIMTGTALLAAEMPTWWLITRICYRGGPLPDLPHFLDDACRRGVLSRSGEVYRIRYPQFADHLSEPSVLHAIGRVRLPEKLITQSPVRPRWPASND